MKISHLTPYSTKSFFCLAALSMTISSSTQAATATSQFQVSATVLDSCLVAATNLVFGSYAPSSGNVLNATSVVTATCTAGTDYEIALDTGSNGSNSGTITTRAMASESSNYLNYELYLDESRSTVWGDVSSGNTVQNTSALLGVNTHTVYGQIPADQYVPAGLYSDTIQVTVTY